MVPPTMREPEAPEVVARRARAAARKRFRQACLWSVVAVAFMSALWGSARFGVDLAKRDLPASARANLEPEYESGLAVRLGTDGEPLFFGYSVKALRDFYFEYPSADERRRAETAGKGVFRYSGELVVQVRKQDADVLEVDVKGSQVPREARWVHRSQMPPDPGIAATDFRSHSGG